MPRVSVVMACRDSEPAALCEAITSILYQTCQDFELIIVDDGSKCPIQNIIEHHIEDVQKIRVFRISPSGLGAALNHGISKAKGEFIARLDDDDLMLPTRLERQVEFLDSHPDVSCVGTWFYDKSGNKCYPHRQYPTGHEDIVRDLLSLKWGLAHTAVMFRKSSFDQIGGYRIAGGGQDLDLFLQLGTVGHLANIDSYLTCYTVTASGLATINSKRYEAYLFALNDVLKRGLYPQYSKEIKAFIQYLNNRKKKASFYTMLIRNIMIMKIKILGQTFSKIEL